MISGNLRMEIGMDIGSKSKLAIFHNNLNNTKLNRNIRVNSNSINYLQLARVKRRTLYCTFQK